MAQTQADKSGNFSIILGDPIELTIVSEGSKKIEINDTGKFMIKSNITDSDSEAKISMDLTCTVENQFEIKVTSAISEANLLNGTYYYSVKQDIGMDTVTIVPDGVNQETYPKITVGRVLING